MTVIKTTYDTQGNPSSTLHEKVIGKPFAVGDAFNALAFRYADFKAGFDPLIMVDHYSMNGPTFGAHHHAGLSAVSVIFEDSVGRFHNRDSLGNDFDLQPGDLYWLQAGSGVFHDEEPRTHAQIHGLQIFVNSPNKYKDERPSSLHVKAEDVPIIREPGARVRVLLGSCNGTKAAKSPSTELTILDGLIDMSMHFDLEIEKDANAWIYAVSGNLQLVIDGAEIVLEKGTSVTLASKAKAHTVRLVNIGQVDSQFAVLSGKPLNEPFVQKGPLVAADEVAMHKTINRKQAGDFGIIPAKL